MEKTLKKKLPSHVKNSALVGIGYWGKVHFKYLNRNKKVKIKKIYYSKNYKNILKLKIREKSTNNLRDILDDNSISHVDIVTPVETHAPLAIKFLKKNKNVLVEKPLILNKIEEIQIKKLQKKNKKKLVTSYPYLFSKSLLLSKKIIQSNKLGKLRFIEIMIKQCGRFMKFDIKSLLAPHAISIFSIFHNPNKIKIKSFDYIKKNNKKESLGLQCSFKNKILGTASLSLNYASDRNIKIINLFCDKGTIICDLGSNKHTISSFKYQRVKKGRFKVAKIKKYIAKSFDEKNNMKYVIDDFFSKNKNQSNFRLTEKINEFMRND